jgi:hypothetical protein
MGRWLLRLSVAEGNPQAPPRTVKADSECGCRDSETSCRFGGGEFFPGDENQGFAIVERQLP